MILFVPYTMIQHLDSNVMLASAHWLYCPVHTKRSSVANVPPRTASTRAKESHYRPCSFNQGRERFLFRSYFAAYILNIFFFFFSFSKCNNDFATTIFNERCTFAEKQTHTPLALTPTPGCIMTRFGSLRPPSSPGSPWKLVFLTNHSSCPLLSPPNPTPTPHPLPPQETEISTRRRECEALEAEVKKKNQTCQTLVSAPKIRPRPLREKDRGWD